MTRHLSPDEISQLLIGENAEFRLHIEECGACRRQLEELEDALRHFRFSAEHWGRESNAPLPVPSTQGLRALAVLSLFLSVFAGARVFQWRGQPAVSASMTDATLLETVTRQVSQPFAAPLRPLAIFEE